MLLVTRVVDAPPHTCQVIGTRKAGREATVATTSGNCLHGPDSHQG